MTTRQHGRMDEPLHRVSIPGIMTAIVLGFGVYSLSIIWNSTLDEATFGEVATSLNIVSQSAIMGLIAWWYLRRAGIPLRHRWRWPEHRRWGGPALLLTLVTAGIWWALDAALPPVRVWDVWDVTQIPWWAALTAGLVIRVILAPAAEETMIRGGLFPVLERWSKPWLAAVLSAVVYVALHNLYHTAVNLLMAVTALYTGCRRHHPGVTDHQGVPMQQGKSKLHRPRRTSRSSTWNHRR